MGKKNYKGIVLIFILAIMLMISSYFITAVPIRGQTIVGVVVNEAGDGVPNVTVEIYTSTFQGPCFMYGECYCNGPRCTANATTDEYGQYSISSASLLFEFNFTCQAGVGPLVNITTADSCAPFPNETVGFCATTPEACLDDGDESIQSWINTTDEITWMTLWNPTEERYEYRDIGIFDVCNATDYKPVIQGTIPSQSGENTWTYDLTPHMDTTSNRQWNVLAVRLELVTISIDGNNKATFTPKNGGSDNVVFELFSTEFNVSDYQEVQVQISSTGYSETEKRRDVDRTIVIGPECGNGICGAGEDCVDCPQDCGECPGCEPCRIIIDECDDGLGIGIAVPEEESPKARIPWGILVALTALGAGGLAAWLLTKETLLVVSSRNLMRGPLTQEALRSMLRKKGLDGKYHVKSVGTLADAGHNPSKKMQKMADSLGVDLSNFKTNTITERDVKKAKHILLMDEGQKDFVVNHMLHKDKANFAKKMHVLDIDSPASAAAHHCKSTHEEIKQKLKDKLSELFGSEGGQNVPEPQIK